MRFNCDNKDLQYEEESVVIHDQDIRKLRIKEIRSLKVQRKHRPIEESTWKIERDMRDKYPHFCLRIQILLSS